MALKKRLRNQKWRRLRKRRDDPEMTRPYTPQDEMSLITERVNGAGILRSNSRDVIVKNNLESLGEGDQSSHPHRVMLAIVLLALTFILIVAYFVAKMPVKQ
jgi:hypothetical protein